MIVLVNFANESFRKKQKWNTFSAKLFGKLDEVFEYNENDIKEEVLKQSKETLKNKEKGAGNYFWKPFIVEKALNRINYGDYLIYADSGSIFMKSVLPLVEHMKTQKKDILCFKLPFIEKQWTKRDAFILMESDSPIFTDTPQIMATFFMIKKSKESVFFIKSWQDYVSDSRILTDDFNVLGKENYPDFMEHRHDQSVLSLLCKNNQNSVLIERDISDYGYFPYRYLNNIKKTLKFKNTNCLYDHEVINNSKNNVFRGTLLCNRKNNPFIYLLKYIIRRFLYRIGINKF
ncbi:hypothetical protein [uncultured Polaribacter sp.]|uniref:hypothetical protein n=1 Tax=uncultured Polaribacter sp. TaxID=174711 RepID=UPI00260B209B|nr:hypothetical protein [uncultured Polaribacter sp.]